MTSRPSTRQPRHHSEGHHFTHICNSKLYINNPNNLLFVHSPYFQSDCISIVLITHASINLLFLINFPSTFHYAGSQGFPLRRSKGTSQPLPQHVYHLDIQRLPTAYYCRFDGSLMNTLGVHASGKQKHKSVDTPVNEESISWIKHEPT